MSQYKVIKLFADLQDSNHEYNVGDVFPRNGKTVSDARIAELSSENNARGVPLIQLVEGQKKEEAPKSTSAKAKARKKTK